MFCYLSLFFALTFVFYSAGAAQYDSANTQIWGPGLRSGANLPVRYFYIQAFNKKNRPVKEDLGDDAFRFELATPTTTRVRAWKTLLNLHNGTYIARFRLYDFADDLIIAVVNSRGKHVGSSPYTIEEVYGDECVCPVRQTQWMEALQCPPSFRQIELDFEPFKTINLTNLRERMLERFAKHHSICHYAIKKNEVYRECHGSIIDFKMFVDAPLLSLARKVKLPDIEFFINLGDWPLEKTHHDPLPIVSWCGSKDSHDIILPTYDLTNSVLEMMGRVMLDVFSVQATDSPKWSKKIEKGFFRGRDSRKERLDLAEISQSHPDLIEAGITRYFFFKKDESKYGTPVKHLNFFDFFKYKYQLNIDGTVAAYRFPFLMLGDSLVFKQDSGYYEHFYEELRPNEHYVPLKADLSDVIERVTWARTDDDSARRIQQAGTKKARELLTPANVLCYHVMMFQKYASRQKGKVTILDSMEKLKQPKDNCRCRKQKQKPKKAKKAKKPKAKEEL